MLTLSTLERGLVIRSTGSWYEVRKSNGTIVSCRIKGKFRIKGIRSTNPIAVGDWVEFEIQEDDTGVIQTIDERKNYIARKSVNLSKRIHIIASNVDLAFLIVTVAHPRTTTGFIDRFLVSAEAYGIPVVLVFNKIDIYTKEDQVQLNYLKRMYTSIGYDCYEVSAMEKIGLEMLKQRMKDQVSLVSGHSGVGKSTLINALDTSLELKTGEISDVHLQGKHTTTFAEMVELSFGGFMVDTPGIKGFGLIDLEKRELGHYFVEFRALMNECKFNDCQHINEPKCAVLAALESGAIFAERYANYLSMYEDEEEENYRSDIYK